MKKCYVYVLLTLVIISVCAGILFFRKYMFIDSEDLKGDYVDGGTISIVGDYIFYHDKAGRFDVGVMAKNLKTGEKKIVGSGVYGVDVYNDEFYYNAQRGFRTKKDFCKRGIDSFFEKRVTHDGVSSYRFQDDFLYYKKLAYSSDDDGDEDGYIYRINLHTKQKEEIVRNRTMGFELANDSVYYIRYADEGYDLYHEVLCDGIFSHSLSDGEEKIVVDEWIGDFVMEGNNIAYSKFVPDESDSKSHGIYQLMWLNLGSDETIEISNNVTDFNFYDENLCYFNEDKEEVLNIFNCSNGNTRSVVVKDANLDYGFVLYGSKIYCYSKDYELIEYRF